MRISERKRTTRTPDTSNSASRNTETQRNNQRSLLEGGVGSFSASVSALSLDIAIRIEWGKQLHYPSGLAPNWGIGLITSWPAGSPAWRAVSSGVGPASPVGIQ